MFKKTEESEWTRFSRALQSQPAHQEEAVQPDEDETVELSAASRAPAPEIAREDQAPPPPAYARAEPTYSRSEPTYTRTEPAYGRTEPTYERQEQTYEPVAQDQYEEPVAAPVMTPTSIAAPMADQADSGETVLGEGARLEGTLRSDRSIRVWGFISGEIESKERVIVEATARVEARIVAEQVTVIGEVNGQIECVGRVEIAPTGRVTGEVRTGRLAIQEGAFFQGQLTMVPNEIATSDQDATSADLLDDESAG